MKKRTSLSFKIVVILLSFVFFHRFFIQLGIPDATKYIMDILNVMLFMIALVKRKGLTKNFLIYFIIIIPFIVLGTVGCIKTINIWRFSVFNYVFDLRGTLRPFIFLYSCTETLKKKEIELLKKYIIAFHLINCVYIVYQYFTLEVAIFWMRGDNLNGFFGTETGGNLFVNALIIVSTMIMIEDWDKKRVNVRYLVGLILLNLIISVLIELKVYFVEIFIILVIYLTPYLKKISGKRFMMICILSVGGIISAILAVQLLYKIYPTMEGTLSISGMISATSEDGYSNGQDFNRLSFISGVNNKIFKNDLFYELFGVGIGTANLNGEFAVIYEHTHYSWFSAAYVYVEMGLIGMMMYIMLMIFPAVLCKKSNKKFSWTCCLLCLLLLIYDEASRTEACYMLYLLIAMTLVEDKRFILEEKWKTITRY